MKGLASFSDDQDCRQTEMIFSEAAGPDGSRVFAKPSGANDKWRFEWGPPSDVLECTRAQIFDEVLRLRDDERERIGQELHDSAGQLLLSLQLTAARLRETKINSGDEKLVTEIQDIARLISEEIRSVAFLNHPRQLHSSNLATALKALIDGFGKRTGCRVSFKVIGDQPLPNGTSSMALFRVAQEALVNVHRHAHASRVTARLERRLDRLELTIGDDGVGLPSQEQLELNGGVGMHGMQFRVEQLGGRFRISKLKRGTKILASVPLAA